MEPNEVIQKFREYRELARRFDSGNYEQQAIDTMTMAILDGDVETFRRYQDVAKENAGNCYQLAVDTLNMALLDRTQGRGGLVAFLLTPRDKD